MALSIDEVGNQCYIEANSNRYFTLSHLDKDFKRKWH